MNIAKYVTFATTCAFALTFSAVGEAKAPKDDVPWYDTPIDVSPTKVTKKQGDKEKALQEDKEEVCEKRLGNHLVDNSRWTLFCTQQRKWTFVRLHQS